MLTFHFAGEPKAVQSFRFTKTGRRYQPKGVTDWKSFIRLSAQDQLPDGFVPFDCPIGIEIFFNFSPLKTMRKKDRELLANGGVIFKATKPDLADNLCKGLLDALTGIVWVDDSRICSLVSMKTFSMTPGISLYVSSLEQEKKMP